MDEYYYNQVSCIDRQIEELEARKYALLHSYCYTGYHNMKSYIDPYNLSADDEAANNTSYKLY